jgi:hypothetical protein
VEDNTKDEQENLDDTATTKTAGTSNRQAMIDTENELASYGKRTHIPDSNTVTNDQDEFEDALEEQTNHQIDQPDIEEHQPYVDLPDEVISEEQAGTRITRSKAARETPKDNITPSIDITMAKEKPKRAKAHKTYQKDDTGALINAGQQLVSNNRIEIKENGNWEKATVISRAGTAKGKYDGWFNVKLDNGKIFNDNLDKREVRCIEETDALAAWLPDEVMAVMVPREMRDSPQCKAAKENELLKLKQFNTYEVVPDQGQDRLTTTWVLTEKGKEVRARLTARGFQEEEDFPTDSPTMQ